MRLFGFVIFPELKFSTLARSEYLRGKVDACADMIEEIKLRHGADHSLVALREVQAWADWEFANHNGHMSTRPARQLYRHIDPPIRLPKKPRSADEGQTSGREGVLSNE